MRWDEVWFPFWAVDCFSTGIDIHTHCHVTFATIGAAPVLTHDTHELQKTRFNGTWGVLNAEWLLSGIGPLVSASTKAHPPPGMAFAKKMSAQSKRAFVR